MLAMSPEKRRSSSDIHKELCQHEDSILNLEPFPEKVIYKNPVVVQNLPFDPARVHSGYGLPQRNTQGQYIPQNMQGGFQGYPELNRPPY